MAKPPTSRSKKKPARASLMVRLGDDDKTCLVQAAKLRRISVSDYVRTVTIAQARREVDAAREQIISLTPEEQLAFWNALNETPQLTNAQRELGRVMRGQS